MPKTDPANKVIEQAGALDDTLSTLLASRKLRLANAAILSFFNQRWRSLINWVERVEAISAHPVEKEVKSQLRQRFQKPDDRVIAFGLLKGLLAGVILTVATILITFIFVLVMGGLPGLGLLGFSLILFGLLVGSTIIGGMGGLAQVHFFRRAEERGKAEYGLGSLFGMRSETFQSNRLPIPPIQEPSPVQANEGRRRQWPRKEDSQDYNDPFGPPC